MKINWKNLIRNLNPQTAIVKIRDDIAYIRKEKPGIRDPEDISDLQKIRGVVTGRVGIAFAAREVAALVAAPVAATVAQYFFGNADANKAILASIGGDYIAAVATYQAAWILMNRDYYSNNVQSRGTHLKNWAEDSILVHGFCALASVPVYAVVGGLSKEVVNACNWALSGLGDKFPTALITTPIAITAGEVVWGAIFAAFATGYVSRIAPRYTEYLKAKSSDSEGVEKLPPPLS